MSTNDEYQNLVAYLTVKGARKAIEFYKAAFGAEERYRLTSGPEAIGHAELLIGGQVLMLADEFPGMSTSPDTLGGTSTRFVLMVPNADEAFNRAVAAGAIVVMPPNDAFYGYRMASVKDPFGHQWHIQHQIEKVEVAEMQRRWDEMISKCAPQEA